MRLWILKRDRFFKVFVLIAQYPSSGPPCNEIDVLRKKLAITWHDLRHSRASRMAEQGANESTIAAFLRDSDWGCCGCSQPESATFEDSSRDGLEFRAGCSTGK